MALFLDLGSGGNTPVIFKIPFIRWTMQNPDATYATVNLGEAFTVDEIADRSIVMDADIAEVVQLGMRNENNTLSSPGGARGEIAQAAPYKAQPQRGELEISN